MSGAPPRWSVIVPAYNEAARLPGYLKDVQAYFEGRDESYEVVVVDDGSRDGTAERVREVAAGRPAVTVRALGENRGKGYAVRVGMAEACGTLRLMADADGATPIAEAARLEAAVAAGADIAIGSRALHDPAVIRQVRTHRKLSGHLFNFLVRQLGVPGVVATFLPTSKRELSACLSFRSPRPAWMSSASIFIPRTRFSPCEATVSRNSSGLVRMKLEGETASAICFT